MTGIGLDTRSSASHRQARRARPRAVVNSLGVSTGTRYPGRYEALDLFRYFPGLLAFALAASATAVPSAARAGVPSELASSAVEDGPQAPDSRMPPYFVILDSPADFNALLQKIQ